MLSGCLRKAIFNNWETTRERVEGEGKMVREEGRKKERWAIIASFPNLGDKSRWFSLSLPVSKCVRQLPEHPNAMATASGSQCEVVLKRRREERRGFPLSFPSRHVV